MKLCGLDLFSGIGGISLALEPWVRTVAYCESDHYARAVLLSRMAEGHLDTAPIWDDVRTLDGTQFRGVVDIIFGGFPCQDISCAGRGEGLEGKRSGLFGEIMRLAEEIKPTFIFLENVPAIRTRGLARVVWQLAELRFDARWGCLSALQVGAPHRRERWFLLAANSDRLRLREKQRKKHGQRQGSLLADDNGEAQPLADPEDDRTRRRIELEESGESEGDVANTNGRRFEGERLEEPRRVEGSRGLESNGRGEVRELEHATLHDASCERLEGGRERLPTATDWWAVEPDVGRVANGIPARVDRLRCLGNAVVPAQAREAFVRLMGICQ